MSLCSVTLDTNYRRSQSVLEHGCGYIVFDEGDYDGTGGANPSLYASVLFVGFVSHVGCYYLFKRNIHLKYFRRRQDICSIMCEDKH